MKEREPKQNAVSVKARGIMWVDCGRLGYVFYENLTTFVKAATDEEMTTVKRGVMKALELSVNQESETAKPEKTESIGQTQEKAQIAQMKLAAVAAEKEVYKGLYEKLMEKVINI